ncbi:MAG: hypothetical protein JO242_02840, partial [Streptosporangiaceae bacterium]|nr:hypothetical protein [Streptosporangiaceae bacterium]
MHHEALGSAFGLSERPRQEFFLIAPAAEHLLAVVAAEQPVLVLADDVQWLDPQTQDALAFLARRVAAHPFGIIGVIRAAHLSPYLSAGLETLVIGGLDDDAAEPHPEPGPAIPPNRRFGCDPRCHHST